VTAEDVTTVDGELDVTGTLNVTGNTVIGGTLSLPNGIVDNAALANPVKVQSIYNTASNFALSTLSATKVSLTITVPAGFTTAAVSVIGRVFAITPNASADYLYADARIDSYVGLGLPLYVSGTGYSALNVAPFSHVLTGLTGGGTFNILVNAATSYLAWAANAQNQADLTGTIGWYR